MAEGVPGDGGYTVSKQTAAKYIDALKAKSTFLRGLPAESIIPFSGATFSVPQLVSSDGMDYVEEGQSLPEGDMVWGEVKFEPKKIGRIQWASTEILEDSAIDLRNSIANNLLRDASLKFDADAFVARELRQSFWAVRKRVWSPRFRAVSLFLLSSMLGRVPKTCHYPSRNSREILPRYGRKGRRSLIPSQSFNHLARVRGRLLGMDLLEDSGRLRPLHGRQSVLLLAS
ncbi:phage major capsid protein [Streptomyces sp. B21-108]|uniref:phage major capsid protein n=1 Tax=Streptomyces sp. B21-108 TaxID=3039419 RepID=UPI002FF3432F